MFMVGSKNTSLSKRCLGFIYVISTVIVTFFIIYLESSKEEIQFTKSQLLNSGNFYLSEESELLNLHQFRYVINNDVCKRLSRQDPLAVVIVTSYAGDVETRSAVRRAFPSSLLAKFGIRRVFLLALIDKNKNYNGISQNAIEDENKKFKDIVQGNFYEDYKNLTYKHVMGLSWATYHCSNVKYIIKMDHDIIFDFYRLNTLLKKLPSNDIFLAGYILTNMKPIREPANKWYVTVQEYPESNYPNFLSGWLYITTPATAKLLYQTSRNVMYFWIDDLYVTGLLVKKTNISLIKLNKFYTQHSEYLQCCIDKPKYSCDFLIGPSSNDNKLILMFQKYAEGCFFKKCMKRKEENSLKSTCVVKWKEELFGKGKPIVNFLKLS